MCGNGRQLRLAEQPGELAGRQVRQARELDRPIAGRGDSSERSRQVVRSEPANGVELERDLVVLHPLTIGHRTRLRMS